MNDVNSSAAAPKLRFALMCDRHDLQAWQAKALDLLLSDGNAELILVIRKGRPAASTPGARLAKRIRRFRWRNLLFYFYEAFVLRCRAVRRRDASSWIGGVREIVCSAIPEGRGRERFSEDDVRQIRASAPDFILRFGFGILTGAILDAARHGVWSFHHGDERTYRGIPPGFWEIFLGDPVTGGVLQRLTERLDGGVVLKRGRFKTISHSYRANKDRILFESAAWPAEAARQIRLGVLDPSRLAPSATNAPLRTFPSNIEMLVFVWRMAANAVAAGFRRLLVRDVWNVGIVAAPVSSFLAADFRPAVVWAQRRRGGFRADPFCLSRDGRLHFVYEDYDQETRKGSLRWASCPPSDPAGFQNGGPVDAPIAGHASYPFLFEDGGRIFCVPENFQSREVAVYRSTEFPRSWEKTIVLLNDVEAVDPTLFRHDGRLWLMFTDRRHDQNARLFAWYADRLEGPWRPHAGNPIKTDVGSARPAGTPFVSGGALFRPGQDGARTYGGRVVIHRVTALTPERFEEEPVSSLEPQSLGEGWDGTHTLNPAGDGTVIDAKTCVVDWKLLLLEARGRLLRR